MESEYALILILFTESEQPPDSDLIYQARAAADSDRVDRIRVAACSIFKISIIDCFLCFLF